MLLILLTLLLFLAPGYVLVSLLLPDDPFDVWERLIMGAGLSVALAPLLFLLASLIGLRLGPRSVALLVGGATVYCVLRIAYSLRVAAPRGTQYGVRSMQYAISNTQSLIPVLLLLITLISLAARFLIVRNLAVPMWGDSVHHTLIVQLLVDHGGLFTSWEPYLPLRTFTYHYGFHSLVALFHWLTGVPILKSVIVVGQVLNALAPLMAYPLSLRLGGGRWAGVLAVFLGSLWSPMPMTYVNWGRYTQLAGLVLLAAGAALTVEVIRREHWSWRWGLLTAVVLAGLVLTHYRVAMMYAMFLVAVLPAWAFTAGRQSRPAWVPWAHMAACGLMAGVLAAPWLPRLWHGLLLKAFSRLLAGGPDVTYFRTAYNLVGDLYSYVPLHLLILAGLGTAWGLLRRRRGALVMTLWVLLLLLLANPHVVGLPGTGVVNNFAILISLYLPLSILAGGLLSDLVELVRARFRGAAIALAVIVLALALVGADRRLDDLDYRYRLVTDEDLQALAWIREHTPLDARFLVNGFFAFGGHTVVGSDAGWWIPYLTGRANTVPPVVYTMEETNDPEYVSQVAEFYQQITSQPLDNPKTLRLLASEGVTHVYIGAAGGELLDPRALQESPAYQLVYHEDGVWIFEINAEYLRTLAPSGSWTRQPDPLWAGQEPGFSSISLPSRAFQSMTPGQDLLTRVADRTTQMTFGRWSWDSGTAMYGLMTAWQVTGDQAYFDFVRSWVDGMLAAGLPPITHPNHVAPGLAVIMLYEATGDEKYLTAAQQMADFLLEEAPRTFEGALYHRPGQLWVDTLFMAAPFLARYGRMTGDSRYTEEAVRQYLLHAQHLQDPGTGLFFHGWSEDDDSHMSAAFWQRGNGWAAAAGAELLDQLPADHPARAQIRHTLIRQFEGLLPLQDPSGLWHTVVDRPDFYLETSGAAAIGYAMFRGLDQGWLDPNRFYPAAWRARAGVEGKVDADGTVLDVSAGTGVMPTVEDYNRVPHDTIRPWGQGLTLLLLSQRPYGFHLAVAPAMALTTPGGTTRVTVAATNLYGFPPDIGLTVTGAPASVTWTLPCHLPAANPSVELVITSTADTPVGSYPLTITAQTQELTRTARLTLQVVPQIHKVHLPLLTRRAIYGLYPNHALAGRVWQALERLVEVYPPAKIYPGYAPEAGGPSAENARANVESACHDFPELGYPFGEGAHHRACYEWVAAHLGLYHAAGAWRSASRGEGSPEQAEDTAWAQAYLDVALDYLAEFVYGPEGSPTGVGYRDTLAAMWQNPQRAVDVTLIADLLREQGALTDEQRARVEELLSGIIRAWYAEFWETGQHPTTGVPFTVRTAPEVQAFSLAGHQVVSTQPWTFHWDADKGNMPAEEAAWMGAGVMLASRVLWHRMPDARDIYAAARHYVDFAVTYDRPDPVHGEMVRTLNAETGGPYGQRRYWFENHAVDIPSLPYMGYTWHSLNTALFASHLGDQRAWPELVPHAAQWDVLLRSAGETLRALDGTFLVDFTPGRGLGYNLDPFPEWWVPCAYELPDGRYVGYDGRAGGPALYVSEIGHPAGLDLLATGWPLMRIAIQRGDLASYQVWEGRLNQVLDEYTVNPPNLRWAVCKTAPYVSDNPGYHWARMSSVYVVAHLGASGYQVEAWRE